ncbi:calcineurin-like phosphoesterase [Nitzschia inconspicua]|uniref:Calcineurin-like phosphoesterase n=1 Tax=Nitzschia inconspicua TaxID=303405 RepID=A0A9K3L3Y4_9STRA|nr:calcineurin-like phosphoesterase [Nitzschia inconspicua]
MVASNGSFDTAKSFRLGYVTDVEGNIDYFVRYVERSKVLTIRKYDNKLLVLDFNDDTTYFVYGGDAVDKGPGDIRLVRSLVDLKRRYPHRVYLLVGNRDLNKLRLTAELSDSDMARPLSDIPPPHWDPKAPSLWEYLEHKRQTLRERGQTTSLENLNTRVNRLKYLLEHTLGCPKTFEYRRQELALLHDVQSSSISDENVVESFLREVEHPEGSLRQYLECANVAVIIGNTLFCHGAVDKNTMKFVPRDDTKFENPPCKPAPGAIIDSVHEWVEALNQYLKRGLEDYQRRPHFNDDRTSRGGESLMALQNRPAMWGRSIISNCYGDGGCITTENAARIRNDPERVSMEDINPLVFEKVSSDPFDSSVSEWLRKDGIRRVVVGHKPTGDCPAVLSAVYTGVEIVSADTSFADTDANDNRGRAISVVEIIGTSMTDNQLEMRGILRDGSEYLSRFTRLHSDGTDETAGDVQLGRKLQDEYWVKASTTNSTYWLTRGRGRKVEYKHVSIATLQQSSQENVLRE